MVYSQVTRVCINNFTTVTSYCSLNAVTVASIENMRFSCIDVRMKSQMQQEDAAALL